MQARDENMQPHRPCPNCDSRSVRPVLEWRDFNKEPAWADMPDDMRLIIGRCNDCGMVYATNSDEVDMTNKRYVDHRPPRDPVPKESAKLEHCRAQLDMLTPYIPEKARVLDYGAGHCDFLRAARERGHEVEGINPNAFAAEWAGRVLDIKVHPVFGRDFSTDKRYDLIISDQTVEHLDHPKKDLARMRELLTDDGVAYIDVPNWHTVRRLRSGVDCLKDPMHFNYFTPDTLADMAQRSGLRVIRKAPVVGQTSSRRIAKSLLNRLGIGTCSVLLGR